MRVFAGSILLCSIVIVFTISVSAQTTEFTYQGSLQNSSAPANGNFDFEFLLFDSLSGGTQLGATLTRSSVAVTTGTFAVKLDFGANFPGANRFLEIHVRPTGQPGITVLAPRQPVSSSLYSVQSLNATTATTANNATQLGGVAANQYVLTGDARLSDPRPPTAGSGNYVQNGASVQASSNFNISGDGTAGGTLSGNVVNAATQFNIGGERVLSTPGTGNLFVGASVGQWTTGNFNTVVGPFAGYYNTTGSSNSIFGYGSGLGGIISTGSENSFFGSHSGYNNTTGQSNAFFGAGSGGSNTTGNNNAFVGTSAGSANITGDNNISLGSYANVGAGNLTNATAIGTYAYVTQSNSLVLGGITGVNSGTDTNVGIGTSAPGYKLTVAGSVGSGPGQGVAEFSSNVNDTGIRIKNTGTNGRTWTLFSSGGGTGLCQGCFTIYDATLGQTRLAINTAGIVSIPTLGAAGATALCRNSSNEISTCSSSARYKNNINSFSSGLSLIKQLRPVSFNWKDGGMADMGLVAEEVAAIEPLLTTTNASGQVEGVKYDRVSVVLINAVKEQQAQIEALKSEIDSLKSIVCAIKPGEKLCQR